MQARVVPGYLHGFVQPTLVLAVPAGFYEGHPDLPGRLDRLLHATGTGSPFLDAVLARFPPAETPAETGALALAGNILRLLDVAGMPLSDPPRVRAGPDGAGTEVSLPVPDTDAAWKAFRWLSRCARDLAANPGLDRMPRMQGAAFIALLDHLRKAAPRGANAVRLMRAALAAGIPAMPLADGIQQYGWGMRGRWFLGTVTDETPGLALTLCGDKVKTKDVLRKAGLPVPPGMLVSSAEQAIRIAARLGYPVVVKPADHDRGEAVAANLTDPGAVAAGFDAAARISRRVLVEKHLPGAVYRAHIYKGEIWVLSGRIPAGVTGDGMRDIATLVEAENARRRKEQTAYGQINPIRIDREARALLGETGMNDRSVPEAGRFIALKRAANVSTGGRVVAFEGRIHPETEAMLLRACQVLRIDLAGLDIVTGDIAKPWHEVPTAIIEVNAGPQLSILHPQYDRRLLETYVTGCGRIPAALVLTDSPDLADRLGDVLGADPRHAIGLVSRRGTYLRGTRIGGPATDLLAATRSLLVNPAVEALAIVSDGAELPGQGLPLQWIDMLAIAEWSPDPAMGQSGLDAVLAHLQGPLLTLAAEKPAIALPTGSVERQPDVAALICRLHAGLTAAEPAAGCLSASTPPETG